MSTMQRYTSEMFWFKSLKVGDKVLVHTSRGIQGALMAMGTVTRVTPRGYVRVGDILNIAQGILFTRPYTSGVALKSWDEHAQEQITRREAFDKIGRIVGTSGTWISTLRAQDRSSADLERLVERLQDIEKDILGEDKS